MPEYTPQQWPTPRTDRQIRTVEEILKRFAETAVIDGEVIDPLDLPKTAREIMEALGVGEYVTAYPEDSVPWPPSE